MWRNEADIVRFHENPDNLPYDKIEINAGLDSQFINCAYVKSVDVLVNDQFWRSLEVRGMDFVIIDDLDYMLTKRDAETSSAEDAQKNIFLNQLTTIISYLLWINPILYRTLSI